MKTGILLSIIFALLTSTTATADILCAKKNQSVNRSKIDLSSAIRVVKQNKCPSGYKILLDTNSLKGDQGSQGIQGIQGVKGNTGLPALSRSTCQKRQEQFTKVTDQTQRSYNISKTCNSGEYAYTFKIEGTIAFSNDWSIDGDSSDAGSSNAYAIGDAELRLGSKVYDDLFLIGYKQNSDFSNYTTITGSLTETYDVTLICCLLGD